MSKRSPRLQFTEEEQTNPKLKKAIKKADKAANRLEKAEAKIPTKKKVIMGKNTDPDTGKSVVNLRFEEAEKKPPSKPAHITAATPIDALALQFHREAKDSDNSAVEAADTGVRVLESAFHAVSYHQKIQPYRTVTRMEQQADRANLNVLQKEMQYQTTSAGTSTYSKWQQKKAIKKEYTNAKRTSDNTVKASEIASKAVSTAAEKVKQTVEFVKHNSKWILLILALSILLLTFMSIISSCSMMFQGALGSLSTTTYQSTPEDLIEVENVYCGMEIALQEKITNYESLYPGYDEYRITGTVLGHDPYVLASLLSALYGEYTLFDVQEILNTIFSLQYTLTETVVTETRFQTENRTAYYQYRNPDTGAVQLIPYTYEVQVPYSYTICTVVLNCIPMEDLSDVLLTDDQMELYKTYMETQGNYPELFSD